MGSQTSFHLQPPFDRVGDCSVDVGFVFLPLPAHGLLLNHPVPISTHPPGGPGKKTLINSNKSIQPPLEQLQQVQEQVG